ncbi:MAG: AgmX/PglI C-terminal domain-containing protein [Solirubrobacterales bacterium]
MSSIAILDEQALRRQHAVSRERLEALASKLRGIDAELDGLSGEKQQHRLLDDACGALEQLGTLGGAELFWAGCASGEEAGHHLRLVRGRVDAFQKRLGEIEERQETVLQEIEQHQHGAWFLENEILEAQEEAEQRNQEWTVEREISDLPARLLVMPWMRVGEEDERFRKLSVVTLLWSLMFALWAPLIELPLPEPAEAPRDVPRLTRLIMEQRKQPPPSEAVIPEPPKQALAAETPAESKPKEGPGVGPGQGPGKGILAFREKLSGFAENQSIARLGSQARISSPGETPSAVVERSMLTTQAAGSSGGINLADLSRGVVGGGAGGGRKIEGVQIARVTSSIGGGGGRGSASSVAGGGPPIGRTDEEIQIVFDRHKSALYRLYNRELRRDPTLQGQVVLRIRIEPDGSVTLCELQGTDMNARQLIAQVIERVKTFDFGAKPVPAITILYPIDFLPAT